MLILATLGIFSLIGKTSSTLMDIRVPSFWLICVFSGQAHQSNSPSTNELAVPECHDGFQTESKEARVVKNTTVRKKFVSF